MRPESERLDLYHHYARQLLDVRPLHSSSFVPTRADHNSRPQSGHAYRCFCSPDRLAQTRERLARAGLNSTYDKHCLSLSSEDVARRVRAGEKNVVRLNVGAPPSAQADRSARTRSFRSRTRFSPRALLQSPTSSSVACATRTRPYPPTPSCSSRISSPPTISRRSSTTTRWASRTSYAERSGAPFLLPHISPRR